MKQILIDFLTLVLNGEKASAYLLIDNGYIAQDTGFEERWNNFQITSFEIKDFVVTRAGGNQENISEKYRTLINSKKGIAFVKNSKIIPLFIK